MQKIKKILISFAIFAMLFAPALVVAQGLIPACGKTPPPGVTVNLQNPQPPYQPCDFGDLMDMINNLITFILVYLAVPIAAIMFAYAGFLLVFSGGNPEGRTRAKSIFGNTVWGLVFIAGAWLIVKTILSILGFDGGWIGFI